MAMQSESAPTDKEEDVNGPPKKPSLRAQLQQKTQAQNGA